MNQNAMGGLTLVPTELRLYVARELAKSPR